MYLEASSPRQPGDNAILASPQIASGSGDYCATFWYHMYGAGIGSFNIRLLTGNNQSPPVWSRHSNQGNQWNRAQVDVKITSGNIQVCLFLHISIFSSYIILNAREPAFNIFTHVLEDDIGRWMVHPLWANQIASGASQKTANRRRCFKYFY